MERRLVLDEDGTHEIGEGRYGDTVASGLSREDVARHLAAHVGESFEYEYFDGYEWGGPPPDWLREAMRARGLSLTCPCRPTGPGDPGVLCAVHGFGGS